MDRNAKKNRIIEIFTFIVHTVISLGLVLLGYISQWFDSQSRSHDPSTYIAFSLAVAVFSTNVYMLFKRSMFAYVLCVLTVVASFFIWIVFVASLDALPMMLFYLLLFIPLTLYKLTLSNDGRK